jgi:hypothetical protein
MKCGEFGIMQMLGFGNKMRNDSVEIHIIFI